MTKNIPKTLTSRWLQLFLNLFFLAETRSGRTEIAITLNLIIFIFFNTVAMQCQTVTSRFRLFSILHSGDQHQPHNLSPD